MNIPQVIWNNAEKKGLDWISTGGGLDYIHREVGGVELVLDLDAKDGGFHTYTDVRQMGEPCAVTIYKDPPHWTDPFEVKEFDTVGKALHWMANYFTPVYMSKAHAKKLAKKLFAVRLTDTRVLETRFDSVTNSKKRKRVTKDGDKFWTIERIVEEPSVWDFEVDALVEAGENRAVAEDIVRAKNLTGRSPQSLD
jgi:hypothetical protein